MDGESRRLPPDAYRDAGGTGPSRAAGRLLRDSTGTEDGPRSHGRAAEPRSVRASRGVFARPACDRLDTGYARAGSRLDANTDRHGSGETGADRTENAASSATQPAARE